MLEQEIIQERGFRNVRRSGQVVGFQVAYRSCYYRSVWLSMSLGFDVSVDGENVPRDHITVTIGGKTYTQEAMKTIADVQWPISEAAVLTVAKPGGLKPGVHEVESAGGTPRRTCRWKWEPCPAGRSPPTSAPPCAA